MNTAKIVSLGVFMVLFMGGQCWGAAAARELTAQEETELVEQLVASYNDEIEKRRSEHMKHIVANRQAQGAELTDKEKNQIRNQLERGSAREKRDLFTREFDKCTQGLSVEQKSSIMWKLNEKLGERGRG